MRIRWNHAKGWSSHMPMLIRAVQASEGTVVEVGAGFFSTPLLHWLCKDRRQKLITYENTDFFYAFAKNFQSRQHRIIKIDDWDDMDFDSKRGVVFIDHHPNARRGVDALKFANSADYIVMHDTDAGDKYAYTDIWPQFKYVTHWKEYRPWASVVSNFKDVTGWNSVS